MGDATPWGERESSSGCVKPSGSKQIESWYSYSGLSSGNVMMPPSLARCLFTVYNFINELRWIAIFRVPPCFDCIFAVFQDFELKFSVCLILTMALMCSPIVFVAVSQKMQYRAKRGPGAKISVQHFSPPFFKQLSWNFLCDARRLYSYRPGEWPSFKLVFKTMLDKNTPKNADFSTLSDLAENWRISSLNFYQSSLKVWTKNINQKPLILIFFILKCQNSAKPNRTFILGHPVLFVQNQDL